jgi:hypothetical protein
VSISVSMEKPEAVLEEGGLAGAAVWACRPSEAPVNATRPSRRKQELDQKRRNVLMTIHLDVATEATV